MEIKTVSDLQLATRKRPKKVVFNFPGLDTAENEEWGKKYNDLLEECGCSSGRQFITYTAPFYIILIVFLAMFTNLSKPLILGIFAAAVVITGITGKIKGLRERDRLITSLTEEFLAKTGAK